MKKVCILEEFVFLCICFFRLEAWPWPPSSMQIQKPSKQGVENINTSLLIRVSLPHSGCRGKWKWGAIAELSFWRDICHTGSVNKCDYVKGNSSTLILHTHMVQSTRPLCNFTFWHPIDQNCAPSWNLIQLSSDPRVRNVVEWNQFLKPFRKIKLGNKFCEVPRTPADDIVACNVPIELLTALSSIQIVVQTQIYGNNFFSYTLQCNDVHYHFGVKVETFRLCKVTAF